MSTAREKRRAEKRAMKRAGVELVTYGAIPLADTYGGVKVDVLVAYVGETIRALAGGGADLNGRIAITIGSDHPSLLTGQTVIEAKAAKRNAEPERDDDDASGGGLLVTP